MQEEDKMKVGDRVKTSEGMGVIESIEYSRNVVRYGVKLENNPFEFSPVYYNRNELEVIS